MSTPDRIHVIFEVIQWLLLAGILFIQSRQLPVLGRIVGLAEKLGLTDPETIPDTPDPPPPEDDVHVG